MIEPKAKIFRCYLDTSVFNWAIASERGEEQKKTVLFLERCRSGTFEAYVSDLVLAEIIATPDAEKKNKLVTQMKVLTPISLELEEAAVKLADRYIEEKIIPPKARDDARHVAIAVVNNLDVVVSWNLEHMVRLTTRRGVNAINQLEGYKPIEIATAAEVL